ncbi:hypothetical protein EYF80_009919 [Liparis tanakae]|uniref:Uncharacterized protein n=1 Tax=Liparis tanakae TaxID=230148 RepID=A0A4Z2IRL2_9TELE|nr:hypothetical protein EYF80_009919 [Liparis tanakae]
MKCFPGEPYHRVAHLVPGGRQVDPPEELPDARLGGARASRQQNVEHARVPELPEHQAVVEAQRQLAEREREKEKEREKESWNQLSFVEKRNVCDFPEEESYSYLLGVGAETFDKFSDPPAGGGAALTWNWALMLGGFFFLCRWSSDLVMRSCSVTPLRRMPCALSRSLLLVEFRKIPSSSRAGLPVEERRPDLVLRPLQPTA